MRKSRAAIPVLLLLLIALPLASQTKAKKKTPPAASTTPGTTTITWFDEGHTVVGWLELVPFTSQTFHNTRMLRVLVPANYLSPHNAHRSYPVLYLQDGQNLFDEATAPSGEWHVDETVDHLVGSFRIPPMIVVGIDNAGEARDSEYLPYPDAQNTKSPADADATELHGREYAKFLLTEVMPFIEKKYRLARGAANTGIGGSSYGGDIALYTALEHPGVFGHLLVESPALWIGDRELLRDADKAKLLPQKIYVGIGTNEEANGDSARSAEVVKNVQELEGILHKKGLGPNRLQVVVEEGGKPNEAAWSRRLPEAMLFLYGK